MSNWEFYLRKSKNRYRSPYTNQNYYLWVLFAKNLEDNKTYILANDKYYSFLKKALYKCYAQERMWMMELSDRVERASVYLTENNILYKELFL